MLHVRKRLKHFLRLNKHLVSLSKRYRELKRYRRRGLHRVAKQLFSSKWSVVPLKRLLEKRKQLHQLLSTSLALKAAQQRNSYSRWLSLYAS